MMWHASPIINGCLLGTLLFGAAAEGAVNARYLRVEAPLSGRLALQKIEIHSGEQDLARQNKQLGFASSENDWLPIGNHKHAKNCIQGKIEADGRGARVQARQTVGAWMEFDLHREAPINRVVVARGISDSYGDRFYRIVSLLDAERRVVFTKAFDIRDPAHRELIHTFDTSEPRGELIGTVVPPAADGWMSVGRLIKIEPAKQAADATARRAAFEQRNRPAAIEALAHEFFGVMDLEKPELEPIARLYRAGRFQQSLDAYRDHFLNNKIDGIHNVWGMTFGSPRYAGQADDLLEGRVITVGVREVHGIKYTPATTDWGALPQPDSPEFDAALAISRSWAQVNHLQGALLDAYAETGETRYLDRWAVMTDDWSMHFFDDIERSPHNIRDFFVKDTLQSFVGFCVVLHDVAQRRPEFVEQAPSATLARLLLPILEEYPPPLLAFGPEDSIQPHDQWAPGRAASLADPRRFFCRSATGPRDPAACRADLDADDDSRRYDDRNRRRRSHGHAAAPGLDLPGDAPRSDAAGLVHARLSGAVRDGLPQYPDVYRSPPHSERPSPSHDDGPATGRIADGSPRRGAVCLDRSERSAGRDGRLQRGSSRRDLSAAQHPQRRDRPADHRDARGARTRSREATALRSVGPRHGRQAVWRSSLRRPT